jgi:hypothetical protein
MIIENPLSHVVVIRVKDIKKYAISPSVRIIIRKDLNKLFILEDFSSRVFELEYTPCLEDLFEELREKRLDKRTILRILKRCYRKESRKIFNELINLGIIW